MSFFKFLYEKIYKRIDAVIDLIVIVCSAVMVLSLSANVIIRLITDRSIPSLDEVSLMCYLWITYVCAGQLYRTNAHIRIDFVLSHLPSKLREVLEVFNTAVNTTVSGYIAFLAWKIMLRSFNRTLNVTHVPYAYMHLAIGIGFTIMTLYSFSDMVVQAVNLFRKESLPDCKYIPEWKARAEE